MWHSSSFGNPRSRKMFMFGAQNYKPVASEPDEEAAMIRKLLDVNEASLSAKALSKLCRMLTVDPHRQQRTMELSECEIDDAALAFIASRVLPHFPFLNHLYVDSNLVGPSALSVRSVVAFASQVTHFTLVDNNIGDEGAIALARGLEMPECAIEYLDLSSNKIHAKGAQALAKALETSNLKWLSLQCNLIGDTGCRDLALALKKNQKLESLFLANNFITDSTAGFLLTGLSLNTTLCELHINDNFLHPKKRKLLRNLSVSPGLRMHLLPIVALAYGTHKRLGRRSLVYKLPADVMRNIRDMIYSLDRLFPQYNYLISSDEEDEDDDDLTYNRDFVF